jgi:hypothetical protein
MKIKIHELSLELSTPSASLGQWSCTHAILIPLEHDLCILEIIVTTGFMQSGSDNRK